MWGLVHETVQRSILGPILYAIYVTHHFDLHNLTNLADDNFIIRWNSSTPGLVVDLQASLKAITEWLKGAGLTVNESKTEQCLFHQLDQPRITINLFSSEIKSLSSIKALGVLFDTKIQWSAHVSKTILKANRHFVKSGKSKITLQKMSSVPYLPQTSTLSFSITPTFGTYQL
jgi:hypothetical protein